MPGIADQIRELVRSVSNLARRIRRLETLQTPITLSRPSGGHTIQDEGGDLPDQVYLDFIGAGVTAEDDLGNGKTTVTIPGLIQEVIGAILDRIILIHADGFGVDIYNPISEGFDYALTGASSGDVIYVPPATIGDDHIISAGVEIWGAGRDKSIFTGVLTLGAESALNNVSVLRTANDAVNMDGVIIPAGTTYLFNSNIFIVQAGSGDAVSVKGVLGGTTYIRDCALYAESGSGAGYAGKCTSGIFYVRGGEAEGSTQRFVN